MFKGIIKWLRTLNERCPESVLHDKLLVGETKVSTLTNNELLNLYTFKRWYHPTFEVYTMVGREMQKRRKDDLI